NEPNVYTNASYLSGEWPPQIKNPLMFLKVYWNLTQVHKRAYAILKRAYPDLHVGISMNMANARAKDERDIIGSMMAYSANYLWNRWFLNRIRKQQDFIGLNYYMTDYYESFR